MRSKFPAYNRIHKDDLLARFDECVFMFDACALLDIYRMKKDVTEDVFKVMEHMKEQIRIPYHVAEEYFDNIHGVLNKQITNIKQSQTDFNNFINTLEAKRSQPYISKKATDLLSKLKLQVDKDFKQQEEYIKEQLVQGEYQNRLNDMLEGKVLEPFSEEELEEIVKEGEKRLENKIPPGYKDTNKSSNRYGDLVNWKEILRYAKESGKCIVIVSSEIKEDWVLREQGCTICLRYELLKEFYETVGNNSQLIHFLSLDRFFELVREKDAQVISEATVNEVKDYVAQPMSPKVIYALDSIKMPAEDIPGLIHLIPTGFEKQIENLRKIQELLDPKLMQDIQEITEKIDWTSKPLSDFSQKATKTDIQEGNNEDKASSVEDEGNK